MPEFDFSRDAAKALRLLPSKHARQVLAKILSLQEQPEPHDSRALKGKANLWRRVDSGEYRIVYRLEAECLKIDAIGHRNDDRVYRDFERKL